MREKPFNKCGSIDEIFYTQPRSMHGMPYAVTKLFL